MAILITLKTVFEPTEVVQLLENKTYNFLLGEIVRGGTTQRPDVWVIDISKIKTEPGDPTGERIPRKPIKELIKVFTSSGAKSVGVDIDFSPVKGQLIYPEDRQFFDWCLEWSQRTNTPIVLGVKRTANSAGEWLSDERYKRLAGFIGVRRYPERATYWFLAGNGRPLQDISAALARVDLKTPIQGKRSLWGWTVQPTSLIDFSPLERIQEDVEHDINPDHYWSDPGNIGGRMIILGYANADCTPGKDPDCSHITGVSSGVNRVYLHACAANKITAGTTFYQLTLLGRIALDVALALLVFALIESSSWLHRWFGDSIPRLQHRLNLKFTISTIIFVLIASTLFVRWTRLLWTDFILVCAVLLLQMIIELFRSEEALCSPESSNRSGQQPTPHS